MLMWANPYVEKIKRKFTIGAVQACLTLRGGGYVYFSGRKKENHKMFYSQTWQDLLQADLGSL